MPAAIHKDKSVQPAAQTSSSATSLSTAWPLPLRAMTDIAKLSSDALPPLILQQLVTAALPPLRDAGGPNNSRVRSRASAAVRVCTCRWHSSTLDLMLLPHIRRSGANTAPRIYRHLVHEMFLARRL
eukprot:439047-Amphidinium_carterae.1